MDSRLKISGMTGKAEGKRQKAEGRIVKKGTKAQRHKGTKAQRHRGRKNHAVFRKGELFFCIDNIYYFYILKKRKRVGSPICGI